MKKAAKATHGGHRPGTGRPAPLGRKTGISVSLTPDVQEFLKSELGSVSRSDFLDAAVRSTESFRLWLKK